MTQPKASQWEDRTVKDQVKRFEGFLSRCWIPTTPEENDIFEGVKKSLVPYVETLLKQVETQAYDRGYQTRRKEEQKRLAEFHCGLQDVVDGSFESALGRAKTQARSAAFDQMTEYFKKYPRVHFIGEEILAEIAKLKGGK